MTGYLLLLLHACFIVNPVRREIAGISWSIWTCIAMNHGNSLLGSAKVSQESLGEAHRGLERNQDALAELEKQVCVILIRQRQIPMS